MGYANAELCEVGMTIVGSMGIINSPIPISLSQSSWF